VSKEPRKVALEPGSKGFTKNDILLWRGIELTPSRASCRTSCWVASFPSNGLPSVLNRVTLFRKRDSYVAIVSDRGGFETEGLKRHFQEEL